MRCELSPQVKVAEQINSVVPDHAKRGMTV
jgi:hypothetical protein